MNPLGAGDSESGQLSFWEHLAELRKRLLFSVISMVVGFVVAWTFKEPLFALVSAPVKEGLAAHGIYRLTAIETIEAIMVYLKLSLAAAIVVTIPVSLWQIWLFVKPGLVPSETRPMRRVAILAVFMFALGLLFCYRFVLPLVIDFLTGFTLAAGDVDFQVTMKSTYSTTLVFLVGFGVIFELPLVMVLLAATPLFDAAKYWKWIRYAVVVAFVVGSMLTPPDILSQALMAVPITILYVVGIGLTYLSQRRRDKGRSEARGIDWELLVSVTVLSGLIAALVMPATRPISSYLPYGARSVYQTSGALPEPICHGLWPGADDIYLEEVVCGVYLEGTILLARADEETSTDSLCQRLSTSPRAGSCQVVGDTAVVGQPLLVARYATNRDQRLADSDPLSLDDDARVSLFVSLLSTPREQRAYLRVLEVGGDEPSVRIDLSFGDPKEAEHFIDSITNDAGKVARAAMEPEPWPLTPQDQALLELTAALQLLTPKLPAEKATAAQAHLDRVRTLLGPARTSGEPGSRLLQCTDSPCAYAALIDSLPKPQEPEVRGRVVTLRFPADDTDLVALRQVLQEVVEAGRR